MRDDAVLAQIVVAAVERDLLAVVADEDERVARLALVHAPRRHRQQRRDAAAVVARAGEPGVVVRAEHDHAGLAALDAADDVRARGRLGVRLHVDDARAASCRR